MTLVEGSNEAERLGSTAQAIVTETQWNDTGQPIAVIDPEGNLATLEYYPEIDPDGDAVPTFSLYVPLAAANETGYLSRRTLDAGATYRRASRAEPAALASSFRYDAVGNVVSQTSPRGVASEIEYNAANEIVRVLRGADVGAAIAAKQLPAGETALRFATRLYYDHNGRVVRTEV